MPRPASLSSELLQTFVTLVQTEGDAGQAADILGINQPSMSKRLAHLQHAGRLLKKPWLERVGKTWRLTDEGKRVLPAVEDLLRRYEQLTVFVEAAFPTGLSVACGRESLTGFVLAAVKQLYQEMPHVKFRLSTLRGQQRIAGVSRGKLDLALVTHDPDQIRIIARRPLLVEELFEDPLVLACPTKSPWAEAFGKLPQTPVPARSLTSLPLILPEENSGIRENFDSRIREAGVSRQLDVAFEVGGWSGQLACVEAGLGVGLLPRSILAGRPHMQVRTLQASITPPNRVRLIVRSRPGADEADLSEAGIFFRDALRAAALKVRELIGKTVKR